MASYMIAIPGGSVEVRHGRADAVVCALLQAKQFGSVVVRSFYWPDTERVVVARHDHMNAVSGRVVGLDNKYPGIPGGPDDGGWLAA